MALVVTIVVLLILAGVTITYVFSDNGILSQAQSAANKTDSATVLEEIQQKLLAIQIENKGQYTNTDVINVIKEVTNNEVKEYADETTTQNGNTIKIADLWNREFLTSTDNYIGYYADIDNDGVVDGYIYADLLFDDSGIWWEGASNVWSYEYFAISGVKNYYISSEDYEGPYGNAPVISAYGDGEDRFYVMSLTDYYHWQVDGCFTWYFAAYTNGISDYEKITSGDFGAGKSNTSTMVDKFDNDVYANTIYIVDIWYHVNSTYFETENWFVPSTGEWAAFAVAIGLTPTLFGQYGPVSGNYASLGFDMYNYWTSTLYSETYAWMAPVGPGGAGATNLSNSGGAVKGSYAARIRDRRKFTI